MQLNTICEPRIVKNSPTRLSTNYAIAFGKSRACGFSKEDAQVSEKEAERPEGLQSRALSLAPPARPFSLTEKKTHGIN